MAAQNTPQEEFSSLNIISFFWKWRWPLIIIPFVAALAAAVFSGPSFITPLFKSQVVLFPASTNSLSKAMLSQTGGSKADIMEFGEEEESEQLLQILNSSDIRSRIIWKYDLMNHYEIDTAAKFKMTRLYKQYDENITFRRTEYMAVEISVRDKDPEMAANIANDIAGLLDSTKNRMTKERAAKAFMVVSDTYFKLRNEVQAMEDSLTVLREYGVHDYESQAEMINRQLAMELARGNQANVRRLEDKLALLAKYGGPYVSIRDQLEYDKKNLSEIKEKYEEAKVDAESVIPQTFIVDRAFPAEKKTYPVRWLIVVVSAVATFFVVLLCLIVVDNFRNFRKSVLS